MIHLLYPKLLAGGLSACCSWNVGKLEALAEPSTPGRELEAEIGTPWWKREPEADAQPDNHWPPAFERNAESGTPGWKRDVGKPAKPGKNGEARGA